MNYTKIDYAPVDAAILAHIKSNPGKSPSSDRTLQGEVLSIAHNEPVGCFTTDALEWRGMRMIDRRLQAMKKSGRIKFNKTSRSWELQA